MIRFTRKQRSPGYTYASENEIHQPSIHHGPVRDVVLVDRLRLGQRQHRRDHRSHPNRGRRHVIRPAGGGWLGQLRQRARCVDAKQPPPVLLDDFAPW